MNTMEDVKGYISVYFLGLPLFLLSLLNPLFGTIYALAYFLMSVGFLVADELPRDEPEHSTITHFERASRWNFYNYTIAASLVVAALLVSTLPILPQYSTFIIWTLSCIGLHFFTKYFIPELDIEMISDYLHQQLPTISLIDLKKITASLMSRPDTLSSEISEQFKVSKSDSEKIIKYFNTYLSQNYEPVSAADPGSLSQPAK